MYCFTMVYIYQTINNDYILEFFKISNFLEEYKQLIERDGFIKSGNHSVNKDSVSEI